MRLLDIAGRVELAPDDVAEHVARVGALLISQASVGHVAALLTGWTALAPHPHESRRGLTTISPQPRATPDMAGFTHDALVPHTDRSFQAQPPSVLAAVMRSPSAHGGQVRLVDGAAVLERLRRRCGDDGLASLRLQRTDGTRVPVVTAHGALTQLRYRDDPYASPAAERPEVVVALREAVRVMATSHWLRTGDGYLIHNHRFLHGRDAFTGHRSLTRMLATVTDDRFVWLNQGFVSAPP